MAAMGAGSMKVADKPNLVDLDAGQTKQLTWKFPTKQGAVVIYGSHVPGDYAGGLKGTVTVGDAGPCPQPTAAAPTTMGGGGTATTMGNMPGMTETTTAGGSPTTKAGGTATTMGNMPGMSSGGTGGG
jgi:hypothetical protein